MPDTEALPARRSIKKPLLLGLVLATAVAYAGWTYYQAGLRYQETDNAYVGAHVVQIASRVAGVIAQLAVDNNQSVQQGALLFALDSEPYQLAIDEYEAKLQQASQTLGINRSGVLAARSKLDEKQIQLNHAQLTLDRQQQLSSQHFMSQQSLDNAKTQLDAAQSAVRQAAAELSQAEQKVKLIETQNPAIQESLSKRDQAKLNLKYTRVAAPVGGYVANLSVRPGSYIQPGQALFALIDDGHWWVDANFKETQVQHIRPGNAVTIHIDSCPAQRFEGVVESIASGTGASFSLLPAQNANSNWVKVTQRVPVRIKLLSRHDECPLIIGTSAAVSVAIQ